MVPGMGHCRGGPGPDQFDALSALEAWVEDGVAPDQIVASKVEDGEVVRSRPLCPLPAGRRVDRVWQHGRCRQFRLRGFELVRGPARDPKALPDPDLRGPSEAVGGLDGTHAGGVSTGERDESVSARHKVCHIGWERW